MEGLTYRVTPLPNFILFDYSLPAAALLTYFRLLALAWRSDYCQTGRLGLEAVLMPLLGVQRSQLRQHLRLLRIAKLITWQVSGRGYQFTFLQTGPPGQPPAGQQFESGKSDSGVGVVNPLDFINNKDQDQQQQTPQSEKPDSLTAPAEAEIPPGATDRSTFLSQADLQALAGTMGGLEVEKLLAMLEQPAFSDTVVYLTRAGIWTERVLSLAHQVLENERQGSQLLPTRADVLGWIAYCFACGADNSVRRPVRVLVANLDAGRRCPDEYRPPLICQNCGLNTDYCDCEDQPQPYFPEDFIERALTPRSTNHFASLWGVCPHCQGYPCRCE